MKRALCLTAFFFISVFKPTSSNSNAQDTSLSNPNPQPISPLPIYRNDAVIVVALDGSISLVDSDSKTFLWTYKSGLPIYSSYQAPHNVDTYIDVDLDWQLYMHYKTKGITKRLSTNVRDLVSSTPIFVNGTTIIGQMTTTVTILDAKLGTLVQTFSPSPFALGFDGENPIVLGKVVKKLVEPGNSSQEAAELIYITRTDYAFMAYSETRSVLWSLMYSDITAELSSGAGMSCSRNFFSPQDTPGLEEKADFNMPTSCQRNVMVYRVRDHGCSDKLPLVGFVNRLPYSLPGSTDLVAYSADMKLGVPDHGHAIVPRGGIMEEMLASPYENITPLALPAGDLNSVAWPSFIVLGIFLLLMVVGFLIYRLFVSVISIRQDKDLTFKPSVTKKKKSRKSGTSKNSNQMDKLKGNVSHVGDGGSSVMLADARMSLIGLTNDHADGRWIGKLYISSKEIAKGSNGTVVFEGDYDGRPVAVKRLVQSHHDVAQKEIQNLIASDQHPNIVRWYGMEYDSDFVYLSLERCACNLNDLISYYSQPSKIATASQGKDPYLINEYIVQLQQRVGSTTDFELWRSNGYPSTQLLKLMRDVVSGLAHLHEIGIIHRDLKPQNVLIIKEKTFCAKLSDMGISKRLDGDMISLSQHATGIGSSGWRSPEQLKNGRQTRAMDLFSLGCVLFFCITGGRHPFGDAYERDANIVNNQKDLFLVESIPEALDLISHLLDPNPDLRLKAVEVLHHPLFWNSDTRLQFLRDVSDRVELEDRETGSELLKALESVGFEALGGKWDEKLDNSFLDNIGRYRRYKYDSVRDLLRVVRNKLNHYRELPKDIQETLGSVPDGFDYYFTSRFPRLLIEVYRVIRRYCEGEELLSKYFKSTLI